MGLIYLMRIATTDYQLDARLPGWARGDASTKRVLLRRTRWSIQYQTRTEAILKRFWLWNISHNYILFLRFWGTQTIKAAFFISLNNKNVVTLVRRFKIFTAENVIGGTAFKLKVITLPKIKRVAPRKSLFMISEWFVQAHFCWFLYSFSGCV